MADFLLWLEATAMSTWLRESLSPLAFPTVLTLHTVGMGFLVGTNAAVDLRVLGVASQMPLKPMERFFPVMWFGFGVNAFSGVLLLIAYPTKAVTNPLFYVKLMVIGLAVSLFQAVTTIHEQTLTFVPKALAVIAVLLLLLPWLVRSLIEFTTAVIEKMPQMVQ